MVAGVNRQGMNCRNVHTHTELNMLKLTSADIMWILECCGTGVKVLVMCSDLFFIFFKWTTLIICYLVLF